MKKKEEKKALIPCVIVGETFNTRVVRERESRNGERDGTTQRSSDSLAADDESCATTTTTTTTKSPLSRPGPLNADAKSGPRTANHSIHGSTTRTYRGETLFARSRG